MYAWNEFTTNTYLWKIRILWHGHLVFYWHNLLGISRRKIQVTTKNYPILDVEDRISFSCPFSNMLTHGRFIYVDLV